MATVPAQQHARAQDVPLQAVEPPQSLISQGGLLAFAGAGLGMALGLSAALCGYAPWWAAAPGVVIGAGLGMAAGGTWVVADHRQNVRRLVGAIETAVGADLDGDGKVGDENEEMDTREKDRRDFGTFIAGVWPVDKKYFRGTASRDWIGTPLDTSGEMTRAMWDDFCERLVQQGLIRKTSEAPNSPYQLRANREQALKKLAGQIILPNYAT